MSAAVPITRLDKSADDLRALARKAKNGRVVGRLLSIALVLEGASRKYAAESSGMDRQSLRDWIHRYNDEGVAGLEDRKGAGAKLRIKGSEMDQLAAWVKAGPDVERDGVVRWRRKDLADRIKQEMKIEESERTVGNYLGKLGFRRMTVRPEHPKTDKEAQEALKKTSQRS